MSSQLSSSPPTGGATTTGSDVSLSHVASQPVAPQPYHAHATTPLEIAAGSPQPSYGANDVRVNVQPVVGSLFRQHSADDLWSAEAGGQATYLPAPPSPRTPINGTRRRRDHTPQPGRRGTPQLNVPPALGLKVNGASDGVEGKNDAGAPLLPVAARDAPLRDEIHADDLSGRTSDTPSRESSFLREHNEKGDATDSQHQQQQGDGDNATEGSPDDYDEDEDAEDSNVRSYDPPPVSHSHKLGQWMATGICGNDITSSCLYVTGLCVADAGIWAPVCLLMVVVTLYLFRKIYGEAVTALPLNGGAYNVLLNTTSKSTAAVAACLTILSYVATAVVSGSEAIQYLHILWPGLNVTIGTIVLLSGFAFLNLMGITDSARVAFAIFSTHMVTMTLLCVIVFIHLCEHGFDVFKENYYAERQPVLWRSIIYGFSSAMLGVSGFESSANFVEEQREGVFVKTLRNMWVCVSIFNPLLAFLALTTLKQDFMSAPANQPTVLAEMGKVAGGQWLEKLVSADAFLVLSGGVLTSFVGVTGLCRRLALDRCLPQMLLAENAWRHTNHWIILGFLGICSSMYLILNGNVESLSNVYSVSFMSVMGLFAIGNMLLKYKRGHLKREVTAPWIQVFLALGMIILSLGGLLAKDTSILVVWCLYFFVTGGLVATMFFRVQTLKILYSASRAICGKRARVHGSTAASCLNTISQTIKDIGSQSIGFFAKSGKLSVLNKAILYVRANEECASVRIIHVYEAADKIPVNLLRNVNILDEAYPKIKIDLVLVPGVFSPEVIDYLSEQLHIPKNLMFITCPTENFTHKIETLGGVRLITH